MAEFRGSVGVEFRESVGEGATSRELTKTLARIMERSQGIFSNPLEAGYVDPVRDEMVFIPGVHPYHYVAEVRRRKWLGFIPRRERRTLFAIHPGFYGGAYGNKEIRCAAFDRSILDIVRDELRKYADAAQATAVDLTLEFAPAS